MCNQLINHSIDEQDNLKRKLINCAANQIKSKLLVCGAVSTIICDNRCQHATGKFESIRMLLTNQTGCPTYVQPHPSVNTVE